MARESAGVHDTEVDDVFVAIVPVALPKEYVSVCVKEEDALVIVIVDALPRLTAVAETVDARGMESSVTVALAVIDS